MPAPGLIWGTQGEKHGKRETVGAIKAHLGVVSLSAWPSSVAALPQTSYTF